MSKNRTPLIIIGAGNVGGFIAYNINDFGSYEIIGFLDDDIKKHGNFFYGYKVLGPVDAINGFVDTKDISAVIAISQPLIKRSIYNRLIKLNLDFPIFVAKNAWVSKGVSVGKGVIIYPGVSINYETTIGSFVVMNMNCAIGHNCTVQDYCTLAPGVNLGGFTVIEHEVNVGIGVSTRQNIRIGARAVIGGQSMVVKDVEPGSLVMGVPAKMVK